MLYLMRKIGQSIMINNNVEVKVMEIRGKNVKLGFSFPPDVPVLRKEVFDKVMAENLAATSSDGAFLDALDDLPTAKD